MRTEDRGSGDRNLPALARREARPVDRAIAQAVEAQTGDRYRLRPKLGLHVVRPVAPGRVDEDPAAEVPGPGRRQERIYLSLADARALGVALALDGREPVAVGGLRDEVDAAVPEVDVRDLPGGPLPRPVRVPPDPDEPPALHGVVPQEGDAEALEGVSRSPLPSRVAGRHLRAPAIEYRVYRPVRHSGPAMLSVRLETPKHIMEKAGAHPPTRDALAPN